MCVAPARKVANAKRCTPKGNVSVVVSPVVSVVPIVIQSLQPDAQRITRAQKWKASRESSPSNASYRSRRNVPARRSQSRNKRSRPAASKTSMESARERECAVRMVFLRVLRPRQQRSSAMASMTIAMAPWTTERVLEASRVCARAGSVHVPVGRDLRIAMEPVSI